MYDKILGFGDNQPLDCLKTLLHSHQSQGNELADWTKQPARPGTIELHVPMHARALLGRLEHAGDDELEKAPGIAHGKILKRPPIDNLFDEAIA